MPRVGCIAACDLLTVQYLRAGSRRVPTYCSVPWPLVCRSGSLDVSSLTPRQKGPWLECVRLCGFAPAHTDRADVPGVSLSLSLTLCYLTYPYSPYPGTAVRDHILYTLVTRLPRVSEQHHNNRITITITSDHIANKPIISIAIDGQTDRQTDTNTYSPPLLSPLSATLTIPTNPTMGALCGKESKGDDGNFAGAGRPLGSAPAPATSAPLPASKRVGGPPRTLGGGDSSTAAAGAASSDPAADARRRAAEAAEVREQSTPAELDSVVAL